MEDAYRRFRSETAMDLLMNQLLITDESGKVMSTEIAHRIPPVVSEVVDHQIEVLGEQRPERVVLIDGETIAMTEHKPWTPAVPMSPQGHECAVFHAYEMCRDGRGDVPPRCGGQLRL